MVVVILHARARALPTGGKKSGWIRIPKYAAEWAVLESNAALARAVNRGRMDPV
jgi:hypothetical protein